MRKTHDAYGMRLPEETQRLYDLSRQLDPARTFTYRCTPRGRAMDITIKAISLREAAYVGAATLDELTADR